MTDKVVSATINQSVWIGRGSYDPRTFFAKNFKYWRIVSMDPKVASRIASHIVACYMVRELDRVWLDRLASTGIGDKVRDMPLAAKQTLEFIAYLASGYAISTSSDPSSIRSFINTVLTNVPPALASRMMSLKAGPVASAEVRDTLNRLEDVDLVILANSIEAEGSVTTGVQFLSDRIAAARQNLKKNRRIFKSVVS